MACIDDFRETTYTVEGEDEKGKYIKTITDSEVPCGCHPETCCHFSGKTTEREEVITYITE